MIRLKPKLVALLAIMASLISGGDVVGKGGENGPPEEDSAEARRPTARQVTPQVQAAMQEVRDTAASLAQSFTVLKQLVDVVVERCNAVVDYAFEVADAAKATGLAPDAAALRTNSSRLREALNHSLPEKMGGLRDVQQNFQALADSIATTPVTVNTVLLMVANFEVGAGDLRAKAAGCAADSVQLLQSAEALKLSLRQLPRAVVSSEEKTNNYQK